MQYRIERPSRQRGRRIGGASLLVLGLLLLFCARSIAYYIIEYQWWKELGQVSTWLNMMLYSWVPTAIATLLAFAALWMTHARALKFAGASLSEHSWYTACFGAGPASPRVSHFRSFGGHLDRGPLRRLARTSRRRDRMA